MSKWPGNNITLFDLAYKFYIMVIYIYFINSYLKYFENIPK